MSTVRPTGFYNYVSRLGGMAQRFVTAEAANTNKVVALSFKPLIPMIIAGSALIYNQGHESTKPGGGEQSAWMRILAESGLAYLVLENTAGIYPLFGIGLAAYRAGKQSNELDQIKSVINTAVTLFMGSVGVTFFKGMSKMAEQMDDQAIFRMLRDENHLGAKTDTHIHDWLDHLENEANSSRWKTESQEVFRDLHENLHVLERKLGRMYPDWLPKGSKHKTPLPPDSERFRALSDKIMNAKTAAAENFAKLGEDAFHGGMSRESKQAVKRLMASIDHSQGTWTRMVRGMNPLFGYIIMGLLVGAPLARWMNSWIGRRRPDLQQKQFHQFQFPQENRVLPSAGHGGHGAGGHGSTYGQPYMTWPGMNNNQPTFSDTLLPQTTGSSSGYDSHGYGTQPRGVAQQVPPHSQNGHH